MLSTRALLFISLAMLSQDLLANEPPNEHEYLTVNSRLEIHAVFEAALANAPEIITKPEVASAAQASRNISNAWFADRPRLNLDYWDDAARTDTGMRESQINVEMALWNWQQRDTLQQLSSQLDDKNVLWQAQYEWTVSGRVRESLHKIFLAEILNEFGKKQIHNAQAVLNLAEKHFKTGDISRLELMQAQSELLDAEQAKLDYLTVLVDSERAFQQLTGLQQRPANLQEIPSTKRTLDQHHPWLSYLANKATSSHLMATAEKQAAKGNATLAIGLRRDHAEFNAPNIDSVGISLSVPFGFTQHANYASSQIRMNAIEADIALENARRDLALQLHEAQHELEVTEASMTLKQAKQQLAEEHYQLSLQAFAAGELDMQSTLKALQAHHQANLELTTATLRRSALISQLNYVLGESL